MMDTTAFKQPTPLPVKPLECTRIIFISDVHLGHRYTPTTYIVDNLLLYVVNDRVFKELDALIISGDLFDKLLKLNVKGLSCIHRLIFEMLRLAKLYNVAIRILEGTPSHDMEQAKIIIDINSYRGFNADVKYYDTCQIINDEALGLTIGYIQDEHLDSYIEAQAEMEKLMETRCITQLDVAVLHGLFGFQLPIVDEKTYNAEWWAEHVRYATVIGHDHNPKSKYNITIPGSFDRTAHNEEGDKGFLVLDICKGKSTMTRMINHHAMPYLTFRLEQQTELDFITAVEQALEPLPCGMIRIQLPSDTTLRPKVKQWRENAPQLTISDEYYRIDEPTLDVEKDFKMTSAGMTITESNIEDVIMRELEGSLISDSDLKYEIDRIKSTMR